MNALGNRNLGTGVTLECLEYWNSSKVSGAVATSLEKEYYSKTHNSSITTIWLSAAESLVAFSRQSGSFCMSTCSSTLRKQSCRPKFLAGSPSSHVVLAKHIFWSQRLPLPHQHSLSYAGLLKCYPTQDTAYSTTAAIVKAAVGTAAPSNKH